MFGNGRPPDRGGCGQGRNVGTTRPRSGMVIGRYLCTAEEGEDCRPV